jgi:tetratricopeptide (TPR) repeat protein
MTPDQLCAMAQQQHHAGNLTRAEALYRAALERDPNHGESLHCLGRIAQAQGDSSAALALIAQAVKLKPRNAVYRDALGLALLSAGRHGQAADAFRHAIRLDKSSLAAHYNLGNALMALGQHADAAQSFRRAIAINPEFASAHSNLGNALGALGEHERAAEPLQRALDLEPGAVQRHVNLANTLVALQRNAEAITLLQRALSIDPNHAQAMKLLVDACGDATDAEDETQPLRRAVALAPGNAGLISRLALHLHLDGRESAAGPYFRRALELAPGDAKAHRDLGVWLRDTGDLAGAEACLRAGLALAPSDPSLHHSLALTLLCMGRLREGFEENEWRWQAYNIKPPYSAPAWTGAFAPERRLLVMLEQGQGDMIHFMRYLPLAAERTRVVLEVFPSLRRLAEGMPGISLFAPGEPVPEHDFWCPLLSLPRLLGRDDAPLRMDAGKPYVNPDPDDAMRWGERLAPLSGRKIGLAWAGARNFAWDRRRSVPPALFDRLACADTTFVSLQKDAVEKPSLPLIDWTGELRDFADTAALIANLDLVISVDTAVAHLAGAMGKPVWLLNRFDSDWRWLRAGDTTLWYPSMRLFRQPSLGDWESVMAALRSALQSEQQGPQRSDF